MLVFETVESTATQFPDVSFTFNGDNDIRAVLVPSGFDHTVSYVDRDDTFAPDSGAPGAPGDADGLGAVRSACVPVAEGRAASDPGVARS